MLFEKVINYLHVLFQPTLVSSQILEGSEFFTVMPGQFRALQSLCIRAQQTLNMNLKAFGSTSLISDVTITSQVSTGPNLC